MNTSLSKQTCSHRFIDQYSDKCLHCGYSKTSVDPTITTTEPEYQNTDDDNSLDIEHYERLVLMLDEWKKTMTNRIEIIYKSKLERLRDDFERQQAAKRRARGEKTKIESEHENENETFQLTNINFQLINSSHIDTEYTLISSSSDTILIHDGRTFKLFDKNLHPLVALDLTNSMRERSKVVDMCYVLYLSSYLTYMNKVYGYFNQVQMQI